MKYISILFHLINYKTLRYIGYIGEHTQQGELYEHLSNRPISLERNVQY